MDEGAYSNIALDQALNEHLDMAPRDKALATELVYGTLTWLRRIDAILVPHVRRGLRKLDPALRAILRVAVYQLGWLRVPDHAAVDEAVKDARRVHPRKGRQLAGLVNAVLRNALRARDDWPTPPEFDKNPRQHLAEAWSLPSWIARLLLAEFSPEEARALAEGLSQRPRLTLRAVTRAGELETGAPGGLHELATRLEGEPTPLSQTGLWVTGLGEAVREALHEGEVVVQDEGAQLVGLLGLEGLAPDARVLDACAGLGGKILHLAEHVGAAGRLVAVDDDAAKLEVLQRTAARLGTTAIETVAGDFRELSDEALGGPFDLVVVDAPCSGLGVLRRRPEIRWLRKADAVPSLAALQSELLTRAAALLAPGGRLVYSVCTFTRAEGPAPVEALLAADPTLTLDAPTGPLWGALHSCGPGLMTLPHLHQADGFFMARLKRR